MGRQVGTTSRLRVELALFALAALAAGHPAAADADSRGLSRSIAEAPAADATAAVNAYYLEAFVNGAASGLIVSLQRRANGWWLPLKHLYALGLRTDDLLADAGGWVALDSVTGLAHAYEPTSQSLQLTVLASRRVLNVLRHEPQSREGDSATGAILNYDAILEEQRGTSTLRAFTEQRAFGDWGVLSNRGTLSVDSGRREYVRLESFWTLADPESLRSITAGDLVSRSLAWSRSVRLGGFQVARNFGLRPDLVTYPVADFSGEVALPSTVDLYVNQVRQLTGDLPPGPFRVETPPSINGAGQATLVVRDLLGRETVQTLDLYVVPQLLAEGLYDYSFEAGWLRERFGVESADYRSGIAGSASLRYGLNAKLTLESHAEAAGGFGQLGVGLLWQPGNWGRFNATYGYSDAEGSGATYGAGYQYVASRFNLTLDWQHAEPGFRDLPALLGDLPARQRMRAFTGWQLLPRSHLSAGLVASEAADGSGDSRLLTLGLRQGFGASAALFLSAFRDFERDDGDGIYLGWSMAVGASGQLHSEYASAEERTGISIASRSPYARGWDWSLRASRADDTLVHAASRYTSGRGSVSLDYTQSESLERWQLGGRVALVLAGGELIPGRYVHDGFALVSTGLPDVPVLHENRPVGHTNAHGYLLLSDVNAYQPNRVAIDPLAVPFGYRLDRPNRIATPRLAAGTVVRFPIEMPRAATLVLVDASGRPLPAGSRGELLGSGTTFVVGYDGIVYLEGLADTNRLRVTTATGRCEAEFSHDLATIAPANPGQVSCR